MNCRRTIIGALALLVFTALPVRAWENEDIRAHKTGYEAQGNTAFFHFRAKNKTKAEEPVMCKYRIKLAGEDGPAQPYKGWSNYKFIKAGGKKNFTVELHDISKELSVTGWGLLRCTFADLV